VKPKVSVITNSYRDNQKHLVESLKSHQRQRGVDIQLILSTVEKDPAIFTGRRMGVEVVISKRPGIYSQLNNALGRVTGDWYCYSSGNDVSLPTKLMDEVRTCVAFKCGVCYSAFQTAGENLVVKETCVLPPYSYKRHLTTNFIIDSALIRRDILEKYKPFREQYGNHAYWDFWLRVAEGEGPGTFVSNPKPEKLYRVCRSSRHIRRKRNLALRQENKKTRSAMLTDHLKKLRRGER